MEPLVYTLKEEYLSTRGSGASQGLEAEGSTWVLMRKEANPRGWGKTVVARVERAWERPAEESQTRFLPCRRQQGLWSLSWKQREASEVLSEQVCATGSFTVCAAENGIAGERRLPRSPRALLACHSIKGNGQTAECLRGGGGSH